MKILISDSQMGKRHRYIDARGNQYSADVVMENAVGFDSEESAQEVIDSNGWGSWANVATLNWDELTADIG